MPGIRRLEADSELLDGLIEMLMDGVPELSIIPDYQASNSDKSWAVYGTDRITYPSGGSPREAIANAIRKYKEQK